METKVFTKYVSYDGKVVYCEDNKKCDERGVF